MTRKLKKLSAMIFASLFLMSCDKVSDLNTVNFDADFSANVDCVTSPAPVRALIPTFSASAVIEPTSDPNVNIYLTNIQEYEIVSIKATVTSMSQENITITSGEMTIDNFQSTAQWTMSNELLTVGKVITFGNENGQMTTVSQILKDGQEFTIIISGEADFYDVTFTFKVDIETKVTANII